MGICSRNEAGSATVIQADSGCEESKIENTSRLVDAEGKLSTRFSANLADAVHERDGVLEHIIYRGRWIEPETQLQGDVASEAYRPKITPKRTGRLRWHLELQLLG